VARNVWSAAKSSIVSCTVAKVEKVDIRERKIFDVSFLQVAASEHEAIWILVRQLSQEHAISDTKDGGARSDRKRNRNNRGDSKDGTLA